MKLLILSVKYLLPVTVVLWSGVTVSPAFAQSQVSDNTSITQIAINGGADTANPGTSCLQVSSPVSASCAAGYIAIQNNNKQLLAAALHAKATGSKVWLYYDDVGSFHCPGLVFTPCSVISISVR